MANNFKAVIDRQMWIQVPPAPNAHAAGVSMASDLRNTNVRNPFVFQLVSNTVLNRYNIITKAWQFWFTPGLGGTFGAGAGAVFVPSLGLTGSIGAGCSTTSIVTTTAMTAVGTNMLANRGGGTYGYLMRIIGNSAASSGKVEERWIVGNTSGTTPTITLDAALTFTPANGDLYEIIAGRLFMLGAGSLAANSWRAVELATNLPANKTYTGLASPIGTDFSALALDEQYVPYDHIPGEGFIRGAAQYDGTSKYCLTATASAAGTLTGQATGGDAGVLANEYRNFQIRIVEDTGVPTAVNQRRIIASHTAGASPVYTLGTNWAVTPSATAKYVIEYPNLIILFSSGTGNTYTYNYGTAAVNNGTNSINADAWSTAYFAVRGANMGVGCTSFPSYGIEPDTDKNARHSFIYSFRGAGTPTLDVFDIAGGTTGSWSLAVTYDGGTNLNTGSCGKYAPCDNEGRYGYLNAYAASVISQIYRFDVKNRVLSPFTPTSWLQAGTAAAGDRVATYTAIDGTDKYTVVMLISHTSSITQELIVQT